MIDSTFRKSALREELKWKYLEKRLRIYVAIGAVIWMAWMANMMYATAESASNLVYYVR